MNVNLALGGWRLY